MGLRCDDCKQSHNTKICQGDLMLCSKCRTKKPSMIKSVTSDDKSQNGTQSPGTSEEVILQGSSKDINAVNSPATIHRGRHRSSPSSGSCPPVDGTTSLPDQQTSTKTKKATNRENSVQGSQHTNKHCISGCKHASGRGGGTMIRCCTCMTWFHTRCLNLSQEEAAGVWSCFSCRDLTSHVLQTNEKLDHMTDEMGRMMTLLLEAARQSQKDRDQLQQILQECGHLRSEVTQLRQQNADLARQNSQLVYESHRTRERQNNGRTLLIGSSLIRNIDEATLVSTDVVCLRGAKIRDIHHELSEMGKHSSNTYSHIVLLGGGNNCSAGPNADIAKAVSDYKDLLITAKQRSQHVTICSIPPRMNKNQQVTDNIATLNAQLQVLATENDCTFANNHDLFHLKNGAINDGYYYDDIHLTLKGSDAMIKSIGLKQRSGTVSTANIHPRQTSPLTWKIQLPTQGVVHGAPHHKENKAKGSGKQRNQTQQRGKEHPNRVSTGGYTQKAPTANHHHSPGSMDSTPPVDFQHSFWDKARGKARQNRTPPPTANWTIPYNSQGPSNRQTRR